MLDFSVIVPSFVQSDMYRKAFSSKAGATLERGAIIVDPLSAVRLSVQESVGFLVDLG